ncbi:TIGR03618 family F420-dependent PPOX class oxidoreductase [Actinoplanes sp. Pm04-4]|uniref:TIGR03618 family F420-dependent PPOX class oxidoreductase n=1 Tax=Paractinoplanes pyxinae TaxID=2997416 RepID=A0ABT4B6K5_9ACTN|nr:TIGR03618 family F420-dependent PPOX class oxidoreductase [Actinoplanes pyxinae]MCY1142111.1 TIGR03618 family F420-dependent PPOX class oxidoreductase [Actinoplanes pyxinae]
MGLTLSQAWELSRADSGLALVSTLRADQTIQTSLVNTGIVTRDEPLLAFVTYGPVKLANLRARPQITVGFRQGWKWAAVEGRAQLAGPDDPWRGLDAEGLRLLLREIFTAAGGSHDDWDEYDRVMREQRRTAVLITPERVYG